MKGRASVAGERADALEMPGVARRAAAYRMIFGLSLVLAGSAAVIVYYWHRHHPQVSTVARTKVPRNAATEMRLPKLVVDAPHPTDPVSEPTATPTVVAAGAAGTPGALALPAVPTLPSMMSPSRPAGSDGVAAVAHARSSPVLLQPPVTHESLPAAPPSVPASETARSHVKVLHAERLPAQRFLLPRGAFLDCTLETAVDSTLPGLATCLLATDVYGADGTVVLLPRGSRLVGETRSDVRAGQARVGIIWTEARTPEGLLLPLGAAGTDALGRTGVPGTVDRHTTERFGAAVMLSVIDAAASAAVNRRTPGTGVVYNIQGTRDVATEALRQSIHIPPTIRVEPGARVDVIVAADVDFGEVYQLVQHDDG